MIHIDVSSLFVNPIPPGWSPFDNELMLRIGVHAIQLIKESNGNVMQTGNTEEILFQLRHVLRESRENDIKTTDEENKRLITELLSQKDVIKQLEMERKHGFQDESVRSTIREETKFEFTEQILYLKQELEYMKNMSESMRIGARDVEQGLSNQLRMLALEKEEIEKKEKNAREELASMKISRVKGTKLEEDLRNILEENSLSVVNTSEGGHKTHYHDILVSREMLHPLGGRTLFPKYVTGDGANQLRLSIEWKGYCHSSGISEEIRDFKKVRQVMEDEQSAECFLFIATVPIPGHGNGRLHFEFNKNTEGHYVASAYLGAKDVNEVEIVSVSKILMCIQSRLMQNAANGSVLLDENNVLQDFVSYSEVLYTRFQTQLKMADCILETSKTLQKQGCDMRVSILENLIGQWDLLTTNGVRVRSNDTSHVDDAFLSLNGAKRNLSCKIFTDKREFESVKEYIVSKRQKK